MNRWITEALRPVLRADERPFIVGLGFGASPVTTIELYRRVRAVAPAAEVTGLEIDPERVAAARSQLEALHAAGDELPGLSFAAGGFELPLPRRPVLVRAFNVLRQYPEERTWTAWTRLRSGLAERLPKALIHRNVPGEPVHQFLRDFDRAWDGAAPYTAFGPRQRWLAAVVSLSASWPAIRRPPCGGPRGWRLGEVTLPWAAPGVTWLP